MENFQGWHKVFPCSVREQQRFEQIPLLAEDEKSVLSASLESV